MIKSFMHLLTRSAIASICALLLILGSSQSLAQEIPWASSPEEVGMSSERLERINGILMLAISRAQ